MPMTATQQARNQQQHRRRFCGLGSSMVALVAVVLALLLQLPTPTKGSHVINLTGANYEEATKGRTVFLKVSIGWIRCHDVGKVALLTTTTTMCATTSTTTVIVFV